MVCNPIATPDDCFLAEEIAKGDPEVKALLAERYAATDLDLVVCDPWSIHACPLEGRLIQCFMYLKTRCAHLGLPSVDAAAGLVFLTCHSQDSAVRSQCTCSSCIPLVRNPAAAFCTLFRCCP